MSRAAVLIGVNKVVGRNQRLAVLNDAVRGALAMRDWVLAQGFDPDLVKCFTDADEPVRIADIQDAIAELLVDPMAGIGQLLVYFAGHGINVSGTERWLLSKALDMPSEAVNVEISVIDARQGSVSHVVLISDACRTAAVGVAQQSIQGASIFLTPTGGGTAKAVDRFYACALGDPSHEVNIQAAGNAKEFRALYTDALLDVLQGHEPAIIETAADGLSPAGVIRPWPLRDQLEKTLAKNLAVRKLQLSISQTPDAIIMSDPRWAWIARLDPPATPPVSRGGDGMLGGGAMFGAPPAAPILRDWVDAAMARAMRLQAIPGGADDRMLSRPRGGGAGGFDDQLLGGYTPPVQPARSPDGAVNIAEAARRNAVDFPPRHFETRCGLKLRGAKAVEAVGARMRLDWEHDGQVLRAYPEAAQAADRVLLILQDGSGVLVPLLPEFIGELNFGDDGRLVSLAYEASDNSPLYDLDEGRRMARRELRELVVSALGRGVFRPGPDKLDALGVTAVAGPAPDPVLVLLLAYALDDAGMRDRLQQLIARMHDTGIPPLYDAALLAGLPVDGPAAPASCPPGMPLISRGWVGLAARGVTLPSEIAGLPQLLRPALWTHFSAAACALLKTHLSPPEVHHA